MQYKTTHFGNLKTIFVSKQIEDLNMNYYKGFFYILPKTRTLNKYVCIWRLKRVLSRIILLK